jgi:hypothetical protein
MNYNTERREANRVKTSQVIQIRTSTITGVYSLPLFDISAKGAFVQSRMLPELDENLSVEVIDRNNKMVFESRAVVKRVCRPVNPHHWGFAVEFDREFPMYVLEHLNR